MTSKIWFHIFFTMTSYWNFFKLLPKNIELYIQELTIANSVWLRCQLLKIDNFLFYPKKEVLTGLKELQLKFELKFKKSWISQWKLAYEDFILPNFTICCVFRPVFGCCTHPKASQNTLFWPFSTFFVDFQTFIVNLHMKTFKKCL